MDLLTNPNMRIRIRYSGPLIQFTGRRREAIVLPEQATVMEAIQSLSHVHGPRFRRLFYTDSQWFEPAFVIMRNGEVCEDYDSALVNDDEIMFIAEFAGG
jgi:molybdopterin converting factor small subunit